MCSEKIDTRRSPLVGNEELRTLNDSNSKFEKVYENVKTTLEVARSKTYSAINFYVVEAYWNIGNLIIEAQRGEEKAEYGKFLIKNLSKQLTKDFGKGFTASNIRNIRQFYLTFNNRYALRSELSWT